MLRKLRSNRILPLSGLLILFLLSCGEETTKEPAPPPAPDTSEVSGMGPENNPVIGVKTVEPDDPNLKGTEYLERYANGVVKIKGNVLGGKREGQWFSFYENGTPWSQSIYSKGILNGPTVTFYENGKRRYLGAYANGQRTGKWQFWDEQGNPQKEIDYGNAGK